MFLISTAFVQIVGESREHNEESPMFDEMHLGDQLWRSAFTSEPWKYGKSYDYWRDQNDTSNTAIEESELDKIVGGTVARHGEIPWQASVKFIDNDGKWKHSCGASIIDQYFLLSAAHCFYNMPDWIWRVTVGEHNLNRTDAGEQTFKVGGIFPHSSYREDSPDYDIALLNIVPSPNGKGIVFNKFVQPIPLSDRGKILPAGTKLLVSGWGATLPCEECRQDRQVFSNVLLKAEVPVIDSRVCQRIHNDIKISRHMFCAGYNNKRVDTCLGDSGGPAAYKTAGKYVLYGIVSWGEGCALPGKHGVYAHVASFLPDFG